jgi:predicted PurR-regulated permease PerM
MGFFVFFVLFLVFFAKQRAHMKRQVDFMGQYQQPDQSNQLFEMNNDDIFEQFDKRR